MSLFIRFYFNSSMLNIFRTLIRVADFSLPHGYHPNQPHRNSNTHRNKNTRPMWWYNRKVAGSWCTASACYTDTTPTSHTETPTHIETRTHDQCGDTIEKSQAPDAQLQPATRLLPEVNPTYSDVVWRVSTAPSDTYSSHAMWHNINTAI